MSKWPLSTPLRRRLAPWMLILCFWLSLITATTLHAYQDDRTPRYPCVECGGPTGGVYTDPHGVAICPDCFGKEYGKPVWNDAAGGWVPGSGGGMSGGGIRGGGGGGGGMSCMDSCHGGPNQRRAPRINNLQRNDMLSTQNMNVLLPMSLKKGINPHRGKESSLLMAGKKSVAMFSQVDGMPREDVGDEGFPVHVSSGELIYRRIYYSAQGVTRHFYATEGEEWRIKLLDAIYATTFVDRDKGPFAAFGNDDLHRMVGHLLGYDADDIEVFIQHTNR